MQYKEVDVSASVLILLLIGVPWSVCAPMPQGGVDFIYVFSPLWHTATLAPLTWNAYYFGSDLMIMHWLDLTVFTDKTEIYTHCGI